MAFEHSYLTESFSIDGNWWLPSDTEKKIPGKLTFEGGSELILDLYGAFENEFHPFSVENKTHPSIINGISIEGEEFTLLFCHRTNGKWNLTSGYSQVWYSPRFALAGGCFASLDALKIIECSHGLNFLEEWLGKIPFRQSFPTFPNGKIGLNVAFEPEDFFTISISSIGATIMGVEYFGIGTSESHLRNLSFDRHTRILITPDQERDFDWFLDVVFGIRDVFFLLTGVIFDITAITFRVENPDESSRLLVGGESIELSLFYVQKTASYGHNVNARNYPFLFRKLSIDELRNIFENWFEKKEALKTAVSLFLGSIRNDFRSFQVRFLTLMQALETYHRSTREGQYLESSGYDSVFASMVGAIPSGIPNDLRASLISRLRYGNEYSLRKRIIRLMEELGEDCRKLITNDYRGFTSKVVDTRNYLTHYSDELKDGMLDGVDLLTACLRLQLLIHVFLLLELGFSEEKIVNELIGKNHLVNFEYSEISYSHADA
jgi:hypothetical protein